MAKIESETPSRVKRHPIRSKGTYRGIPNTWPKRVKPQSHYAAREEALTVVGALEAGDISPLLEYIRLHRGVIHEQVGLAIFDLFAGGKDRIGFRLVLKRHPDRASRERTVDEMVADQILDAKLAAEYLREQGLMLAADGISVHPNRPNNRPDFLAKEAKHAVAKRFGVTPKQVEEAFTAYGKSDRIKGLVHHWFLSENRDS